MKVQGILPNAPLLYVVGSVGFTPVLSIERHVDRLQELLRHDYPLVEAAEFQNVEIQIENDQRKTVKTTGQLWHFLAIDRSWAISFESQKIFLHTSRYRMLPEFSKRMRQILQVFKSVLELDYYLYQGMRFINLIAPAENETLSAYLPNNMLMRQIDGIVGRQIDGFSGASYSTPHGNLAVRCWMNPAYVCPPDLVPLFTALKIPPHQPPREFALIDTDHGSAEERPLAFDIDGIIANVDAMHATCHKVFESIPTEYALQRWGQTDKESIS